MFGNIGWGEFAVLLVVGLFVVGPERLPKLAADLGRMIRQLRTMANGVTSELKSELGPEYSDLSIRDLHPRTLVRKHLLEEDTPASPATPPTPARPPVSSSYDDVT